MVGWALPHTGSDNTQQGRKGPALYMLLASLRGGYWSLPGQEPSRCPHLWVVACRAGGRAQERAALCPILERQRSAVLRKLGGGAGVPRPPGPGMHMHPKE
jgi:hypothetical protein